MRLVVFAAALGLLAGPAFAADQFDLVCKGTHEGSLKSAPPNEERHYRIDLAAGSWCSDSCKGAAKIQEVSPSQITFLKDSRTVLGDQLHYVSRVDGSYYERIADIRYGMIDVWKGSCDVAPFSGFPATKF